MNGSGQEPSSREFQVGPELNNFGYMNHDHDTPAMMSAYKSESKRKMEVSPKIDDHGEVFSDDPQASNGVVTGRIGANGSYKQAGPESRRIGLKEEEEDNSENLGPLRAFQMGEMRVSSRNRTSSDVEYLDDDGESSVCSENIYSSGDFMNLPCDISSKWSTWERNSNSKIRRRERESLLEFLEKQRRESVGNRLKELRMPNKRHSVSLLSTSDMPIIAKAKPLKDATLPKQMRRASYQSVIGTPFFAKSGVSVAKPLLQGVGQELRERRDSLTSPRVRTPTGTAWESRPFPLRGTESLSGIEHFVGPQENVISSELHIRPSSGTKTRKSDDADEPNGPSNSSLDVKLQTQISDERPQKASMENGCSGNYPGQSLKEAHQIRKDSFSNRIEQIHDTNRPNVASETERECSAKPEILPQGVPSLKPDSPKVSREAPSAAEASLPVTDFRPLSVKMMDSTESHEQFRDVLSSDKSPDNLLNGSYYFRTEYFSDRTSDTSSAEISDKNETKSSVPPELETTALVESYGEGKNTRMSPISSLQTSSRKYCSDIQIQLKEVEPVFPASFRQSAKNASCNGGNRDDLSKGRAPNPTDDEDDVEEVVPNWSSYPGSLPDSFQSDGQNDFTTTSKTTKEAKITNEVPKRRVSTLEINLQSPSEGEMEKVSKKQSSQTDTYDFLHDSDSSKFSTVLSLRTDASVEFRPQLGFDDQNQLAATANVTAKVDPFATSRKSVERNEIFLVQDSSSNRITTLPRDQRSRSLKKFDCPAVGRLASPSVSQQEFNTTPKQKLFDGPVDAVTPGDLSVEVTPSKENVTRITFHSKKDEQRTKFRDGERTWSSVEAIGGISKSGDSWQAAAVRRENRWTDSGMSRDSGRSREKTLSVERIWETLEQPRMRLTKRNIQLESDPEFVEPRIEKPQYRQRHRVASDGGTGEAVKVDAVVRSTSTRDAPPGPAVESREGESLLEIEIQKGGLGLGFCIEGGKDGPYGDRPITVKRLFRGSSDSKFTSGAKDSLRAGDEILSANGRDVTLLSRFVAWNFLKNLPEGTIKFVVRRRTQQPDSNQLN